MEYYTMRTGMLNSPVIFWMDMHRDKKRNEFVKCLLKYISRYIRKIDGTLYK